MLTVEAGQRAGSREASRTTSVLGRCGGMVREREESGTAPFFSFVLRKWKNGIVVTWAGKGVTRVGFGGRMGLWFGKC